MVDKKGVTSSAVSGVVGGVAFLGFLFGLDAPLIAALGAGAAGFAGSWFLLAKAKSRVLTVDMGAPVTQDQLDAVLEEGRARVKDILEHGKRIRNPRVKAHVEKIADVVDRIYKNFETDPKDIKTAKKFLNYYLETAIKIMDRYADLSEKGLVSAEAKQTLVRAEELLVKIHAAFEKQLARLYEDDVLDLDAEMQLLEQTMVVEGLEAKE